MQEKLGGAFLELETRDSKLEKGIDKAQKSARGLDKQFDRTRAKSGQLGKSLASLRDRATSLGKSFITARAAGLTAAGGLVVLTGALARARSALTQFDRIGKDATASGLDPETFQEYSFAADLAGLSQNEFAKGARTLFKNANDAALGTGLMKTSLEKLNPELLQNIINAQSQEERFRLLADAVKNAENGIEQAAIAQAAFGSKGTAFLNFLRAGANGLDEVSRKARDMGIIISNDVIRNSEEMNDRLTTATTIINANLSKAFVDLAPVIISVAETVAGLAGEIANLVEGFKEVENRSSKTLEDSLSNSGFQKLELEQRIGELRQEKRGVEGFAAENRRKAFDLEIDRLQQEIDTLGAQEEKALSVLASRDNEKRINSAFEVKPRQRIEQTASANDKQKNTKKAGTRSTTTDANADALKRQQEAIANVVGALQFETQQLGLSNVEQRINNELKSAGVDISSLAGQQIAGLVTGLEAEKAAIEQSNLAAQERADKLQELNDKQAELAQSAVDVGAAFLRSSEDGKRALVELGIELAKFLIQQQQLQASSNGGSGGGLLGGIASLFGIGGGGGGNIFGSLFGGLPGFNEGADFTVGGRGGIDNNVAAFRVSRGERVQVQTRAQQNAGNGGNIKLEIIGEEGSFFAPRVAAISGDVASATVQEAAPQIVGESVRQSGQNVMPTFSKFRSEKAGGDYRS